MLDVLLLTYKRPELLSKTLRNYVMNHGDFPHRLHIQNNCGTPEVRKVIEDWTKYLDHLHAVQYNPRNYGLSKSTNIFWKNAKAEYVVKIDADIEYEKGFLKQLYDSIEAVRAEDDKYFLLHGRHRDIDADFYYGDGGEEFQVGGVTMMKNSHGGGCEYIAHLPTLKKLGPLAQFDLHLILGWTRYQHSAVKKGYKLALLKDVRCVNHGIGEAHHKKYAEYEKEIHSYRS